MKRRYWTDKEVSLLREIYATSTKIELEKLFGRSTDRIYQKAYALGLKKGKEIISQQSREVWQRNPNHPGRKNTFKKGHKTFNKGLKQTEYMSIEMIKKTKATRFKKGNRPHNWKPVGYSRIDKDGYVEIKIREPDVFQLYNRYVWEKQYGSIPEDHNIIFRDGNRYNFDIENFECISNAELMNRNSIVRYGPDLRKAMALTRKLNKAIKEYEESKY